MSRPRTRWLCVAAALTLVGCSTRIQSDLQEGQASELQAILLARGFEVEKVAQGGREPLWAIEVPEEQATAAVRLLAELGLPRPGPTGFQSLYGEGSLVPSPTEERALFLRALSGEVAQTLEEVDGVVLARVHLVLPRDDRRGRPGQAKASAFLKVHSGAVERLSEKAPELRSLIAGSVDGLRAEAVRLVFDELATSVAPPATKAGALARMRTAVVLLGTALAGVSFALLVILVRLRRHSSRRGRATPRPAPSPVRAAVGGAR